MRIAIIGSGISGLLTARLLAADHDIHVFEAEDYPGGHTNTVSCEVFGRAYAVDTGFMVFNDRTYPNFVRMLQMLDIPARNSDMSFSVRCDRTGLEYQGSSLNGSVRPTPQSGATVLLPHAAGCAAFQPPVGRATAQRRRRPGTGPVPGPPPIQPGVHRALSHSDGCGDLVGAAGAVPAVPGAVHRRLLPQSRAPDGARITRSGRPCKAVPGSMSRRSRVPLRTGSA